MVSQKQQKKPVSNAHSMPNARLMSKKDVDTHIQTDKNVAKGTYNFATKLTSKDKLFSNRLYAGFVNPSKKHLYLESENGITSKLLKERGVANKDLYVVNGSADSCRMIKKFVPKNNVACDMSTNFLATTGHQFQSIWMDYCCTMNGNKYFKPINDLKYILSRKLVESGGIVGFTFSVREPKQHYCKKSVKPHKQSAIQLKNTRKYKVLGNVSDRKKAKWENRVIDFCEAAQNDALISAKLEVVKYYRYVHKNGQAPPQMYVFFIKVTY